MDGTGEASGEPAAAMDAAMRRQRVRRCAGPRDRRAGLAWAAATIPAIERRQARGMRSSCEIW
ncbi:hypothetical protein DR62_06735 [Burkholderia thailandensis]|nr:hypothetical protein DR62_06735 [Burkholderia thailandensis]AOI51871.1 hypothetical protein WI24_08675 [Burkholderia thailandensis]AOJ50878.1 hypothetical protein AQ475_08580 [Burkholderia thailandensis]